MLGETVKELKVSLGHGLKDFGLRPVVLKNLDMSVNLAGPTLKEWGIDQLHSQNALKVKDRLIPLHSDHLQSSQVEKVSTVLLLPHRVTVPPHSIMHVSIPVPGESEAGIVLGNESLVHNKSILPWVAALVDAPDSSGTIRVGLCNEGDEKVRLKSGTRYGEFIKICRPDALPSNPWKLAPLGVHTEPPKKKLTVRQKLDNIIEQLKHQKKSEPECEKPRPTSEKDKKQWIIETFKLTDSEVVQTSGLQQEIVNLLLQYWDTISVGGEYGNTRLMEHEIHTADTVPIKCRNRPINPSLEDNLRKQIKDWLNRGVIEESYSPWSFPLVAAPKRNGKIRWCVDYRRLNEVTIKDTYPLPLIEDNLARLSGSTVFSCLDGAGAFHVISIRQQDRPKTAFSTPFGLFQFRKMPFGLTNGPASYSRLVQLALKDLPTTLAIPYLDDVIVHSADARRHLEDVRQVLEAHRKAGLKLQPEKCSLFQNSVEYLGHLVSKDGLSTVPEYVSIVQAWPPPTTRSEIRIFLGKTGYYRRFIKNYAVIAAPLFEKVGKTTAEEEREVFELTEPMQAAFEQLKARLLEAPILAFPQFRSPEPFILDTDWSLENNAVGGVLSQLQDGKERVIQYGGKKLSAAQQKYSATKGELTAFLYFARLWSYYLKHRQFILRTDHEPLKHLRKMEPPDLHTGRMLDVLASYDFVVKYRPGPKHGNADALSRAPHLGREPPSPVDVATDDDLTLQALNSLRAALQLPTAAAFSREDLLEKQKEDEVLGPLRKFVQQQKQPASLEQHSLPPDLRTYLGMWNTLYLDDDGLLRTRFHPGQATPKGIVCLPSDLMRTVVETAHRQGGHCGTASTANRILEFAFAPRLKAEVADLLKECQQCQQKKRKGPDQRHTLVSQLEGYPFQRLSIDFVGPLPRTTRGNKYILTVRDTFTKWAEAFPSTSASAAVAINRLTTHIFPRFGIPEVVHTDQGTHFTAKLFADSLRGMGIKVTVTPAYNPKSNPVERLHRDLGPMLRALTAESGQSWEDLLPQAMFAVNTSVSSVTGFTPFRLLFGRDPSTPLHLLFGDPQEAAPLTSAAQYVQALKQRYDHSYSFVRKNLSAAVHRRRRQYHRDARTFFTGQKVWLYCPAADASHSKKMSIHWTGPWSIQEVVSPVLYRIKGDATWTHKGQPFVVSIDRLHPYYANSDGADPVVPPGPEHDVLMSSDVFAEHIDDDSSDDDSASLPSAGSSPPPSGQSSPASARSAFNTPPSSTTSRAASRSRSRSRAGSPHQETPARGDTAKSPRGEDRPPPLHRKGRRQLSRSPARTPPEETEAAPPSARTVRARARRVAQEMMAESRRREEEVDDTLRRVAERLTLEGAAHRLAKTEETQKSEEAGLRRSTRVPKKTIAEGYLTWEEVDRRRKERERKKKEDKK